MGGLSPTPSLSVSPRGLCTSHQQSLSHQAPESPEFSFWLGCVTLAKSPSLSESLPLYPRKRRTGHWRDLTLGPASVWGFFDGSDSKETACNVGDLGSIPGLGRSPGGGHGNPLQYFCLENPMDRGAWWATAHRVTKSRTQLSNLACMHAVL